MSAEFEPGEYVFVKADNQEARVIRIFRNGDDKIYEVVFDETQWHKVVRADEIERLKTKSE